MKKKILSLLVAASMMTFGLAGCGSTDTGNTDASSDANQSTDTTTDAGTSDASSDLSGAISLAGSTSMEKLCEALSESFMEKYPNISVTVEYTGSGAGLESLAAGSVDIGNASRH